jgi:pimeloyl-ACP methyl ester carboxylesterase
MAYVEIEGRKVWYESTGEGEPLVLIGGSSLVHRQWEFMTPHLEKRFRVILFDQRGAGLSDRHPDGISVERWVDDLGLILDALGVEKAHIFGTSNGSFIAIRFAARHPERAGAVVHYGMHKTEEQARKLTRIGAHIVDEFGTGRLGSYFLVRLYGIPPELEDWVVERFAENNSPESWKAMHEALEIDLTEDLRRIRSPQMLLMGDRGPMSKKSGYGSGWKAVKAICPGVEVFVIPNASGTACVLEKPGEAARAVIDFIDRYPL